MGKKSFKFIKVIYDPLNFYNAEKALILDELGTQFEFRIRYEKFRERGGKIIVKEIEKFNYFNQFLLDVKARAYIEKFTPSAIFYRESGIKFPEAIDDVVSDKQEVQRVINFLNGRKIQKSKFKVDEAFDLILEALYDVPNRALMLGENYKFLFKLPVERLQPRLIERFKARLHPILQDFVTERKQLERFRKFFWVHVIFSLSSSLASVKAVLGAEMEAFKNIPHKLTIEMFQNLIGTDFEFVRSELKMLPLTDVQRMALVELLNIKKDYLFEDALNKQLSDIRVRIEKGEAIHQSEIEPLKDHIFATDHQREICEITNFLQIDEAIAAIEAEAFQAMTSLEEIKKYYSEVIAPLSLTIENLRRSGSTLRPIIDKKWLELMDLLDKHFAVMLKSKINVLRKKDKVVIFPEILRSCYDRSQKVIVIFIDALPYDFWIYFRVWLKDQAFLIEEHPLLCLLPSETKFNKKSLFLGNETLGYDPEKNEIADSIGISAEDIIYEKVADRLTQDELENIILKDNWRILILSYNILDERIKEPIALGDLLNCLEELKRKLSFIVSFALQKKLPIIFVSDHGIREVGDTLYIKVENLESRRWTALKKIEQLPDDSRTQVIDDIIFAVGGISFSKINKPRYDHGGLSLRELIVPLAVASPKEKILQPPQIILECGEVEENEDSLLLFYILNPNDREIFLKRLQFESCELPIENIWVPSKRDISIHANEKEEVEFRIRVGKIKEFADECLESVAKSIRITGEYRVEDMEKKPIDEEFMIKVLRSAKTVDRGRIEKELEDLL